MNEENGAVILRRPYCLLSRRRGYSTLTLFIVWHCLASKLRASGDSPAGQAELGALIFFCQVLNYR
jgi:hypothetical protein